MSARRSRHWADWNEVTFVAGIRMLFAIHRHFGHWPFRLCLWPVVTAYWLAHSPARRASQDFLSRWRSHTAASAPRSSLAHFLCFADAILDKLLAMSGGFPRERLRKGEIEAVSACLREGRGGVLVTAHMGCLELCQAAAEWVPDLRLTVLVHTRHAEKFNALLQRLRPGLPVRLLQVTEVGPGTATDLARRVADGEFVAIVGDRVPVGGGRCAEASFLGAPARFPLGPWVLAGLLQCPVFLLSCLREADGSTYRLDIHPLAGRIEMPRARRAEALQQWVQRYAQWLERQLAPDPYQWFNFFSFWNQPGHASDSP